MARKRQSDLEKYCKAVIGGRIVAGKYVIALCKKLLDWTASPYKSWHFDIDAAERPVNFIERFCFMPSGRIGVPFKLELYEKAWIESTFGFVDSKGLRRFSEVLIEVARKNGKTSLCSALELYMLIADGEGAPQVYNAANSGDQAELGFNACFRMQKQSALIKKHVTKKEDQLYCDLNMGFIKALCSNAGNLDGLDVHCAVIDELHAMKSGEIYDLIRQGMSAREQPLLFQITTNGFVRNSIFDSQVDYAKRYLDGKLPASDKNADRFLPWLYELDGRDEWMDSKCWTKTNPGLGTVKKKSALEANVEKAKNDPRFRPTCLTKDFNLPENASVAWLSFDEAVNEETFDIGSMGFRYGIVGFDLSETTDLTAAHMLMMRPDDEKIYELSMYWIPEDAIDAMYSSGDRKGRDDAPYDTWIERGLMRTVPGNKIDKRVIFDWCDEIKEKYDVWPYAIGYDPWHMKDLGMQDALSMYFGKDRSIEVRQGAETLSMPMKQLAKDYGSNRIVDNHNPINEWCRMNVQIRIDANMNIKPDKKNMNPKNRIDGFAAEIDAYIALYRLYDGYMQVI